MKKRYIFAIFIIVLMIIWYFVPGIVIQTPPNYMSEISLCMEYKDGVDETGEVTDKQADEYVHHRSIIELKNKKSKWKYPILNHNKIDDIIISGKCFLLDCNNKEELKRQLFEIPSLDRINYILKSYIVINSYNVYFFRVYADLTDDGRFENVVIKKYPWSKQKECKPQ